VLWLILGWVQRNHIPEEKKGGQKSYDSLGELFGAYQRSKTPDLTKVPKSLR